IENKIINLNYQKIISGQEKNILDFREFLVQESKNLEEYNLPFADFLAGRHYSVLQQREKAVTLFQRYKEYNVPFDKLLISIGISTYFNIGNDFENAPHVDPPNFIDSKPVNYKGTSIIVSVDINYLRKYGPQLFVSIIALKKYQVHIHVIGEFDNALSSINEAKELFSKMLLFYNTGKDVRIP